MQSFIPAPDCLPQDLLLGQELKPQVLTTVLPNVARLYDSIL